MDAGFHEFSDKDDPWDAEFEAMVTRLVDHLAEYGRPSLEVKIPVRCSSGSPSLIDQVIAPTWDDNFDDAVLRFGSPEQVVLRTCHGHEILWVIPRATTQLDPEGLAELCAQGRRAERRQLEWRHLLAMANFS
ncbi:MAG: hypothetical protein GY715_12120 [Planctomycetes bacterium]|nr:hypothetical protein [Planctomycetota bacterium]